MKLTSFAGAPLPVSEDGTHIGELLKRENGAIMLDDTGTVHSVNLHLKMGESVFLPECIKQAIPGRIYGFSPSGIFQSFDTEITYRHTNTFEELFE